ncbi:MAG: hypothetical protein IH950_04485 [Bacteroidetes bacterium]|nr:hypothetical protein [Bacteroidota bacterium]
MLNEPIVENSINKEKLLIVVRGGVVQGVFSSNKRIQIDLLDYDNEEYDSAEEAIRDFNKRSVNLTEVVF